MLNYNFFKAIYIKNLTKILFIMFNSFFFWSGLIFYKKFNFNVLFRFFFFIYYVFYKKISFVGKTYRFYKKKKKIRLFFNRAHRTILYFNKFFKLKKKKKNKCKFWFFFFTDIGNFILFIKKTRRLNVFTKRGLRINKLPFLKKNGKKSTYR